MGYCIKASLLKSPERFPQNFGRSNALVVWTASTCPLIPMSSSPFTDLRGIVLSARITIDITVTFIVVFFFFLQFPRKILEFLSLFIFFKFYTNRIIWQFLFFIFLTITKSAPLAKIRWFVCISKSQRIFVLFILLDCICVVHISLVQMTKFQFLAQYAGDHIFCQDISSFMYLLHQLAAFI